MLDSLVYLCEGIHRIARVNTTREVCAQFRNQPRHLTRILSHLDVDERETMMKKVLHDGELSWVTYWTAMAQSELNLKNANASSNAARSDS